MHAFRRESHRCFSGYWDPHVHLRHVRLSLFHLQLLLLHICTVVNAKDCVAQSTGSLFLALQDNNCTAIDIVGKGFTLLHNEVSTLLSREVEGRVTLARNVTIRGAPGLASESRPIFTSGSNSSSRSSAYLLPTLNVAYLKRRIELLPDVTLTLERLFVPNGRQPSATSASGIDIVSLKTDATLILRDVVLSYALCTTLEIAIKYTPAVARPVQFPGQQNSSILTDFCPPLVATANASAATAPGVGGGTGGCWAQAILMSDLAIAGSIIDPQGVRLSRGSVYYDNTAYVCEHIVPMECFVARGLHACVNDMVQQYNLTEYDTFDMYPTVLLSPPPPATDEGGGGGAGGADGGSRRVVYIVVPTVICGTLVLAAAVIGFALRQRRQQKRRQQRPKQEQQEQREEEKDNGPLHPGTGGTSASAGHCCLTLAVPEQAPDRTPTPDAALGPGPGPRIPHSGAATPNNPRDATPPVDGAAAVGSSAEAWRGGGTAADGGATAAGAKAAGVWGGSRALSTPENALSSPVPAVRFNSTSVPDDSSSSGCGGGMSGKGGAARLPIPDALLLENPLLMRRASSHHSNLTDAAGAAAHVCSGPDGGGGAGLGGSGRSGPAVNLNLVLGADVLAAREAVLGRGTFATVLKGQLGGRAVAVKLFHRDAVGGTAEELGSLRREIAILARCQHPNVVELLGAGSSAGGDEVFLVEELMATNLSRACHEGSGLPLARVLAVARDIAAGLAYLHPTVIHRDLKPANVLLDGSGTAKLSDFGLSRLWASTVHTANPEAGTVQYMAPECFGGSMPADHAGADAAMTAITHHSDIYGFGVLLWEMLAVERPWRGLTGIQVALAVGYEQQRLRMPEESHPRFHPKLRKLILQCWEQEPRKRPGAAEIAKRLSLLLQQLQTHGSLDGPTALHLTASGPTSAFLTASSGPSSASVPPAWPSAEQHLPSPAAASAAAAGLTWTAGAAAPDDSSGSVYDTDLTAEEAEGTAAAAAQMKLWPVCLFAVPPPQSALAGICVPAPAEAKLWGAAAPAEAPAGEAAQTPPGAQGQ